MASICLREIRIHYRKNGGKILIFSASDIPNRILQQDKNLLSQVSSLKDFLNSFYDWKKKKSVTPSRAQPGGRNSGCSPEDAVGGLEACCSEAGRGVEEDGEPVFSGAGG